MSEQGGRYNRSFEGLIGAMIVIVLAVVGFFVFRGLFSDPPELTLDAIDYRAEVGQIQASGYELAYAEPVPEGWRSTEVRRFQPEDEAGIATNFFTGDEQFVGLRQVAWDVDDLLEESGVDAAVEAEPLTGVGGLAERWDGWSDPDGDRAFTTTVGDETVVVYGRVSAETLQRLVETLTQAPLTTP